MALFTSDCGAMRPHGHEMAVITSGFVCAKIITYLWDELLSLFKSGDLVVPDGASPGTQSQDASSCRQRGWYLEFESRVAQVSGLSSRTVGRGTSAGSRTSIWPTACTAVGESSVILLTLPLHPY